MDASTNSQIVSLLGFTAKNIDQFITEKLRSNNIDLTKVQLMLLLNLKESDGIPQQDLASISNRDKASMARLIDTLERKGLVLRLASKSDKRINNIHITDSGRALLENVKPLISELDEEINYGLSASDLDKLSEILQKVNENTADREVAYR